MKSSKYLIVYGFTLGCGTFHCQWIYIILSMDRHNDLVIPVSISSVWCGLARLLCVLEYSYHRWHSLEFAPWVTSFTLRIQLGVCTNSSI